LCYTAMTERLRFFNPSCFMPASHRQPNHAIPCTSCSYMPPGCGRPILPFCC